MVQRIQHTSAHVWACTRLVFFILFWLLIKFSEQFLIGFSAYRNTKSLFKISSKSNPGILHCLNGIRFFSMTWVVLAHVYSNITSGNYPANNLLLHMIKVSWAFLSNSLKICFYQVRTFCQGDLPSHTLYLHIRQNIIVLIIFGLDAFVF